MFFHLHMHYVLFFTYSATLYIFLFCFGLCLSVSCFPISFWHLCGLAQWFHLYLQMVGSRRQSRLQVSLPSFCHVGTRHACNVISCEDTSGRNNQSLQRRWGNPHLGMVGWLEVWIELSFGLIPNHNSPFSDACSICWRTLWGSKSLSFDFVITRAS